MKDALAFVLVGTVAVGIVGAMYWFHSNYRCVRSEIAYREDCDTTRDSHGRVIRTHCHQVPYDHCMEWEHR